MLRKTFSLPGRVGRQINDVESGLFGGAEEVMLLEKETLSAEDLEAQEALELPDRELLATVNQDGVVNVGVAVDCAQVQVLTNDSEQRC
jgi:hypothetical protein